MFFDAQNAFREPKNAFSSGLLSSTLVDWFRFSSLLRAEYSQVSNLKFDTRERHGMKMPNLRNTVENLMVHENPHAVL